MNSFKVYRKPEVLRKKSKKKRKQEKQERKKKEKKGKRAPGLGREPTALRFAAGAINH